MVCSHNYVHIWWFTHIYTNLAALYTLLHYFLLSRLQYCDPSTFRASNCNHICTSWPIHGWRFGYLNSHLIIIIGWKLFDTSQPAPHDIAHCPSRRFHIAIVRSQHIYSTIVDHTPQRQLRHVIRSQYHPPLIISSTILTLWPIQHTCPMHDPPQRTKRTTRNLYSADERPTLEKKCPVGSMAPNQHRIGFWSN